MTTLDIRLGCTDFPRTLPPSRSGDNVGPPSRNGVELLEIDSPNGTIPAHTSNGTWNSTSSVMGLNTIFDAQIDAQNVTFSSNISRFL